MKKKCDMHELIKTMKRFIIRFSSSQEEAKKLVDGTKSLGKAHHQAAEAAYKEIYD